MSDIQRATWQLDGIIYNVS